MRIKNCLIFGPDGQFSPGDVAMDGERFSQLESQDNTIDANGYYVVPGFIDLHFHGCAGYDFCNADADALREISRYQLVHGITSICPATMTLPEDQLSCICRNVANFKESQDGATLWGIYLEGPFLSRAKKGAQNESYLKRPDTSLFFRLYEKSGGRIKLVALAPEEQDAMEFIDAIKEHARVSIAHTVADYDTANMAFRHGASQVTHLFNAMPPFTHRAPGVIGAAADSENVYAELICDGVHLHPSAVRAAFKLFGPDRIIFISDSMMATGMPDGKYALGGQPVEVSGPRATLRDGTIAGSVTNLFDCFRTAVLDMGIPLEWALLAATRNPARSLGIEAEVGSIAPGKYADCLLLDRDLNIKAIFKRGKRVQ